MNVPWTAETGIAIGADWLLAAIAPSGVFGRRHRAHERAFRRGDEAAARAALGAVERAARELAPEALAQLAAALADVPDPRAALARARAGEVLADVDFHQLARFEDGLAGMQAVAGGALDVPAPDDALAAAFAPGRGSAHSFYLADAFDAELATRRAEAAAAEAAFDAARSRIAEAVARALGITHVRDGEFVVMREAFPGPLPAAVRVVREAPTYRLCELVLDDEALATLEARAAGKARVAEAEEAVRARLSQAVTAAAGALEEACERLGALDCLVARARFAQRYGARAPRIADEPVLAFKDARCLPLEEALARHGRRYTPISLELAGLGVLTGPNMGGKSAALRTCGFVAACAALGVPVPAASARVALFDEIAWLGIAPAAARAAEEDGLLSSFGAEIVALRAFFERAATRALVLLDEFARTASPSEARALSIAVLETLRERGACGLAATHLADVGAAGGLSRFAITGPRALPEASDGPLSLEDALERIAQAMDYRVRRVEADGAPLADALGLAQALGLERSLVTRARAVLLGIPAAGP
ncbi:MAG: MutS-related protein [Vulcanimicrobiaceae bacterium]